MWMQYKYVLHNCLVLELCYEDVPVGIHFMCQIEILHGDSTYLR